MDYVGNDAPDDEIIFRGDFNRRVILVLRLEPDFTLGNLQRFYGELAVDEANGPFVIRRFKRFVDDQNIPVVDPRVDHGVAFDPAVKGRIRVIDQLLVYVEGHFKVVGGGGWKPCADGLGEGKRQFGRCFGGIELDGFGFSERVQLHGKKYILLFWTV